MNWIGVAAAAALIFIVWRLARRPRTAPAGRARRNGRGDDAPLMLSASAGSDTGSHCGTSDGGCGGDGGGGGGGGD